MMQDLIPPSVTLVPTPTDLRHRLAVALREVDLLRRLIRVAEHAARYRQPSHSAAADQRQGVSSD